MIQEAFRRIAEIDAQNVIVDILKGHLRSWMEREEAERVAWTAPGVTKVIDEIIVAP
jgi:osmotically-inducible protein OsmY